jgi:hypothetical protein
MACLVGNRLVENRQIKNALPQRVDIFNIHPYAGFVKRMQRSGAAGQETLSARRLGANLKHETEC